MDKVVVMDGSNDRQPFSFHFQILISCQRHGLMIRRQIATTTPKNTHNIYGCVLEPLSNVPLLEYLYIFRVVVQKR